MYIADVVSSTRPAPPPFVRLAGHPLRWQLLGELGRSDLRVRELVRLTGQAPTYNFDAGLLVMQIGGLLASAGASSQRADA